MSRTIPASELIVNRDGSIFHLHLRPEHVADDVILVGDPGRVETVASFFDAVEYRAANREFVSAVGSYGGRRFTVLSTGIGTDNIDIVMNELDALVNIDLGTRCERAEARSLRIVRLGTSGAIRPDIPLGSYVMSAVSCGIDGLLNFYAGGEAVCDAGMEEAFLQYAGWDERLARPYFVRNDPGLIALFEGFARPGITFSAPGFYGPQGRVLRLPLARTCRQERTLMFADFSYGNLRAANIEMESSAIAGLGRLLGHRTLTVCGIIAQRSQQEAKVDYGEVIRGLIHGTLERLSR